MVSLQAFPAITEEEFAEGCKALEQQSGDKLNGTDWLRVNWTREELLIKQRTTLSHDKGHQRLSSEQKESVEKSGSEEKNLEEVIEDEVDTCSIRDLISTCVEDSSLIVNFSITLSPTYSVPVLWFSCHYGPQHKPLTLDDVYALLVPSPSSASLRRVGVMGGISAAHHPVSDLPSFFLHPCNTQEALSVLHQGEHLTPEGYLILWLGLIGSAVGLHVPTGLKDAMSRVV